MAHRSIGKLILEALAHFTDLDGKVMTTLRRLAFHPGRLTRDYLAGRRMSQVAPLQLFLIILVVFLFIADRNVNVEFRPPHGQVMKLPPHLAWLVPIGNFIHTHGPLYLETLRSSAEIFGFLTVPIAALLLWLLYWPRHMPLYDHLIFAMHALSFFFIIMAVNLVLPDNLGWLGLLVFLTLPVHLFGHLRGVYGGAAGRTLLRMAMLAVGLSASYLSLLMIWFAVAYLSLRG
ncbi:MAG TPA: DUF3667 domain-containing protein [Acetobacteraceae bacterium]|nr:DUF3667 domain-containing protein [Acetobacteraceae bacterium]